MNGGESLFTSIPHRSNGKFNYLAAIHIFKARDLIHRLFKSLYVLLSLSTDLRRTSGNYESRSLAARGKPNADVGIVERYKFTWIRISCTILRAHHGYKLSVIRARSAPPLSSGHSS